jgi:trimethylamine--corrinoid protein Co-methyltransferase
MARSAGRRAMRERRGKSAGIPQLPWVKTLRNPFPPMEPLSADQVEAIHEASLDVIENLGLEVNGDRALTLYERAGADVDRSTEMVRMDRGLVMDLMSTVPSEFTLTPRNPDRTITLGGNHINFGLVSGPPNVHDRVNGRRQGNMADYVTLCKFAQFFNCIRFQGNQAVAPTDLPANSRHMDAVRANLIYTDKTFNHQLIGAGRAKDGCELVARARGITLEEMADSPGAIGNINVNSPRKLDEHMATGAIQMAELGQATICTPFTLMGAMTPVTMGAALVQQNAEALFAICLTQIAKPGAPVVYGGFTSNVDMKSGAPAFGTPENAKANLAGGQLARRYNIPYRTSGCNASNEVDAQSTYETAMALFGGVMGYGNFVYHAAGWLEGGLVASFEKVMVDVEMIQHIIGLMMPIDTSPEELGVDAIASVAPGGHFFGADHTMARYETAFYTPMLSDWTNSEAWAAAGAKNATERATDLWQQVLEEYEEPPLDADRREALDAYVATRKEEIGNDEP